MNIKYFSVYIAFIISGLLLTGCEQDTPQSSKRKSQPHTVSAETIKLASSTIERRFNALVIAPNTIKISTQIAGTITHLPFRVGSIVKKGQVIAKLDSRLNEAEYQKSLANLERASQNLQRIKKLIPQQLASAEELTTAKTEKKLAQAEVTLKSILLNRCTITAPFNGVISNRLYEPGDTTVINSHILTLVDNNMLIIKSAVPESFISHLSLNKKVDIKIPALSLSIKGVVSTIYPTVDNSTQQITIEATIDSQNQKLFPGQFAELLIKNRTKTNIQIPVNAVQYDTIGTWVYTINNKNSAQQTRIKTGRNINNKIEVISGLNTGDIMITRGFTGLKPGKKVKLAGSNLTTKEPKSN